MAYRMNNIERACAVAPSLALASLLSASAAHAHVQYYDLNQGRQISDLTAAGKLKSTLEFGKNPKVAGLRTVNVNSDRPLRNKSLWTSTYQLTTGAGTFSGRKYTPKLSTASVNVNDVTDWGWGAGTHKTLGDSHKVDFFNFRLSVTSTVTITWLVHDGQGTYVDGGFSLYGGVLAYQGHDDAAEPLNPSSGAPPVKSQSPLDTGTLKDAQGIASVLRNTKTNSRPYVGQFNALKNWGEANPAGNWSNIKFIKAVNARNPKQGFSSDYRETLEKLTIRLTPGDYTIAASGALGAIGFGTVAPSFGVSNLKGRLNFRAVAP
ncbi:MAG: hypothetical protein IPM80_24275 [Proteobacteria bacterium]|nr:hypothetical protein [Pseudomonadota bacterium]